MESQSDESCANIAMIWGCSTTIHLDNFPLRSRHRCGFHEWPHRFMACRDDAFANDFGLRGGRGLVGSPFQVSAFSYLQQFCQHVAFYIHSATFSAIPFVILITGACQPQPEQSACGLEGFVCCLALLRGPSLVQHGGEQHAGEKIDGGGGPFCVGKRETGKC